MSFKKEQVNRKLTQLGWEIPEGVRYSGIRKNHPVRCIYCGYVTIKRLDNLIYREEPCKGCGDARQRLMDLKDFMMDLKHSIKSLIEAVKDIKTPTQKSNNDVTALFRRYIAKAGVQLYGRKMTIQEWNDLSHTLAEDLMNTLSPNDVVNQEWHEEYRNQLKKSRSAQGQNILMNVIPLYLHEQLRDTITMKMVKI